MGALLAACAPEARAEVRVYDFEIVNAYPHDSEAYTQGLFFEDGHLYESTGLFGGSSVRKVALETGEVLQRRDLPADIFGEGIAPWKETIVGLTWRSETGFVFDAESFEEKRRFAYQGEGWGITSDGKRLVMSDGTAELRFLDPKTLKEKERLRVTHKGKPLANLNELEWIDGEIWANLWMKDAIARIDPKTGEVVGLVDLRSLRKELGSDPGDAEVLNGIAWDAEGRRLFVTGKLWPKLFEIRLVARGKKQSDAR